MLEPYLAFTFAAFELYRASPNNRSFVKRDQENAEKTNLGPEVANEAKKGTTQNSSMQLISDTNTPV